MTWRRHENGAGATPTFCRRRRRADQLRSAAAASAKCRRRGGGGAQLLFWPPVSSIGCALACTVAVFAVLQHNPRYYGMGTNVLIGRPTNAVWIVVYVFHYVETFIRLMHVLHFQLYWHFWFGHSVTPKQNCCSSRILWNCAKVTTI